MGGRQIGGPSRDTHGRGEGVWGPVPLSLVTGVELALLDTEGEESGTGAKRRTDREPKV